MLLLKSLQWKLFVGSIIKRSQKLLIRNMASQKKVFMGLPNIQAARDIIKDAGIDLKEWPSETPPTEEEWIEQVKGMHGLYSFGPQKITEKIIEAAGPQLQVVSGMTVGVDSIDLAALKKRGIKLGHTPGVLTDAVAELAVGMLIMTSRKMLEMSDKAKAGGWKTWKPFEDLGFGLKNSVVGIVGLGRIGTGVAKRIHPFGVSKIVYNSRSEKPEAAKEVNATYLSFDDLLRESDFVICCCSMNEASKELFNKEAFGKMKKNAIIVNIGRGGMINQDALVDALKNNRIAGAGLDVTTPEPLPADHPLFTLSNCYITPHIGSAEKQTRSNMSTLAARNLVAALKGESMPAEYPLY